MDVIGQLHASVAYPLRYSLGRGVRGFQIAL
jgi:hypothetical protein